jgi:hypothetical protein
MRVFWAMLAVLTVTQGACSARPETPLPAGQLVREVVYNELNDHAQHGFWRYRVVRRSQAGTLEEDQVETADGPVARLALINGREPTPETERQEQERLGKLLSSRDEQARQSRQYDEDEERIGRILALLPTAFVYEYDGEENGCYRLRFQPDPGDEAHTIEARIFHAMSGTLWVDARSKRLARLEGHVDANVDFGFGILGRLYKGGWFRLVREQVSPTEWKTKSLEVHMNLRALLVKTFARETSETRGGFAPVPAGMSLKQGLALLEQNKSGTEAESVSQKRRGSENGLLAATNLTVHR